MSASRRLPGTTRGRLSVLATAGAVAATSLALAASGSDQERWTVGACDAPDGWPSFEQEYIDTTRAGGEPILETHPDGTLLWGSHAGTTHVFRNMLLDPQTATFAQNYEGQTYYYFSADNGVTWDYVPRTPIRDLDGNGQSGVPASGFSDPEFAIDTAGNVFISEINLANIAISKSTDSGRSYVLQSLVEITASDRQWMEADEEDVLYFVANTFGGGSTSSGRPVTGSTNNHFYKSVDGGQTFSAPQRFTDGQASSEIEVDKRDGTVYQLGTGGSILTLYRLPNARNEMPPNMTVESSVIAANYDRASSIDPTLKTDRDGNLYVTWAGKQGSREGVFYAYSTDQGRSWSKPLNLVPDDDENKNMWAWLDVGDPGGVSVTWIRSDARLTGSPDQSTTSWNVFSAVTQNGLGCDDSSDPGFAVVQASNEAPHTGSICTGGTFCQATGVDRRLGDYFSNTVDEDGNTVIGITDTRQGGPIGLPLVIRQVDGPRVRGFASR